MVVFVICRLMIYAWSQVNGVYSLNTQSSDCQTLEIVHDRFMHCRPLILILEKQRDLMYLTLYCRKVVCTFLHLNVSRFVNFSLQCEIRAKHERLLPINICTTIWSKRYTECIFRAKPLETSCRFTIV